MGTAFRKIDLTVNVGPLRRNLRRKSYLFNEYTQRKDAPGSPHKEMTDIWVRYKDVRSHLESGDFSTFADEHDSMWYPSYYELPEIKKIVFDVMAAVDGERLGGVLITKLPPQGKIYPHRDAGWHAGYYDKYYIPIENHSGSVFGFESGNIKPEIGDVYWFDNSYLHWVNNDTQHDRMSMIVCVRSDK